MSGGLFLGVYERQPMFRVLKMECEGPRRTKGMPSSTGVVAIHVEIHTRKRDVLHQMPLCCGFTTGERKAMINHPNWNQPWRQEICMPGL